MIYKVSTTLMIILVFGFQRSTEADTLPIDELPQDRQVLFSRDVAPVLKKNCIACHNASNDEGGVNLESAVTMKASDVEDVLVPGKPDSSRLFLVASHADEPAMPPEDNDVSASVLNPTELALLRRWILSGAEIDLVSSKPTTPAWQPLPPSIQTVYGSAMTADGRLSAVSFGNQIRVFGPNSAEPIGALEIDSGQQSKSAHDDFVQDLFLDPTGRFLVSAGFRNIKLWELAPFESTTIPKFDQEDALAVAVNPSGKNLAILSRPGELRVGEIGSDRWQWTKSIDVSREFGADDSPKIRMAVGSAGNVVAIQWGNTIRIVPVEGKQRETVNATDTITSMIWRGNENLAAADAAGNVIFWKREGAVWVKTEYTVFDQAVLGLYSALQEPNRLFAIDVSGKIASWNETNSTFDEAGKLPSPVVSASLSPTGDKLWMSTAAGVLGQYSIADKKFVEVAKLDPASEAQFATDNWQTLIGERLVAAHDKHVKQAEANVVAEKKSLATFAKEIESKTRQRDEKETSVIEAKKATEAAATKLATAKTAAQTNNKKRTDLTETVKQLGAEISELETQLAKLNQQRINAEKSLAAIPSAKTLAEAIKAATEAASKADQAAAKKDSELANAIASLRLAEKTKVRGETRLHGLNDELQHQQQVLGQVKADQDARKSKEALAKSMRDQSHATDNTLAVVAAGTRIITRAANANEGTPGTWSLWSNAGDWLAKLSRMPADGELVATGDNALLIKGADGNLQALSTSARLWQHRKTIGSSAGPSPFADRVLSVDVDPAGIMLASGGGEPSRAGELMLWSTSDGSLIRVIKNPHEDTVLCVRFSPDGKTLATGGADRMVKLWDVESGKLIKTLEGHTHHVTSIAWNVNRRQLASGSADATIKIWNLDSGQATRTISGLKTEVTGLVFVGRDDRIGVVGGDSYFRVYRTDNGARETYTKVLGGYLYALDSNRDGSQFVIGGSDGVAVVVDKSGKQRLKFTPNAD